MSAYQPGAVVNVCGRRCVILRDAVAHTLPPSDDIVVIDRCDGKMIYCALSVLKRAREQYPRLPAYGFWQILFHSGLVNQSERLQAIYFDQNSGQYLYQEGSKVAFTGEIRDRKLIATAGYTLADNVIVGNAAAIRCETQRLRLPRTMVLSFEERERARVARRVRFASGFAALAIFLGAALLAYQNKQRAYDADQKLVLDALATRVDDLAAQKMALQETRIEKWPDQRHKLDDLLRLAIVFERFTLPETPLGDSVFEAQMPDPGIGLPPLVTTVVNSIEHRRDGLLSLRWGSPR